MYETLSECENDEFDETSNQFVYKPPTKRKRNNLLSNKNNVNCDPCPSTSSKKHFPSLKTPSQTIPGFQRVDIDEPLPNNNDNNNNSSNSIDNNEGSILNILEQIIDVLGFSEFWKNLIKKCLPFFASLFEKLNSFGPLIASLFSF